MKRSRSMVALLTASALVVAACGGDDEEDGAAEAPTEEATATATEAPEPTEAPATTAAAPATTAAPVETATEEAPAEDALVIWADERKVEPLEAVAPAFTEATGIDVVVELVPFGEIRDQVTQAGPAGEGPDIFVGAHDWTGELAANGVIDPVDVSAIQDQFVPVSLQGFNFEGQNYAVPYVTEAIAMYRNTDLVPDAPATWADLIAACEAAAVENCVVMPGGGDATDAYHQYPFVSAFGGYIFKFDDSTGFDASDVGLDTPEAIQGVSTLADQVASGVVASTNYDQAKNLFLEGSAAFWITGPWELGTMRDQTTINWDVSLIPQIGETPTQPFVGAQGFFLSAFSENALLAQSFLLDFLATDDTMQALYDADPRGTAWVNVQSTLGSDPQVQVFDASAANGIPMPNIPQMSSVWGPLGDNLLLVRNGEATGEEAMTTAAEAVRAAVAG
jgi:arabinogalactan oligomer/maltooligosaccharide transport system substrate-binding protein